MPDINFQITALREEAFQHLFHQSDAELSAAGIRRMIVDTKPGFPCRVSLQDAEIGEEVILLAYQHHAPESPYRSSGPIFVRKNASTARLAVNEIPAMLIHRLLSVRAYDSNAMMVNAEVVEGKVLSGTIHKFFMDPSVDYIHIHNAKPGCFNCCVTRA